MFFRQLDPSRARSFFLFGARGTGKSTFIREQFGLKNPWILDLLDPEVENAYARSPKRLEQELLQMKKRPDWVVIDEVQRVPRLLDMVHRLIENQKVRFILTGSSARKLKRGAANLLAGRAFVYELFPLTRQELGNEFNLVDYLHWGGLPSIYQGVNARDRAAYLKSYTLTYLNEEIRAEQIVRRLDPFRAFLEVSGQVSGKIINHRRIGEEVGVDTKTIQSYFQILEDTLLGFYLPAFHGSVRKSQRLSPKFYLFDTGVKKALEGSLDQKPVESTSAFGELFEAMVILEIYRQNRYREFDRRLSYYATKSGVEIDLVLSRGKKHTLIEIKSAAKVDEAEVRALSRNTKEFPGMDRVFYISRDPVARRIEGVQCVPWEFIYEQGGIWG